MPSLKEVAAALGPAKGTVSVGGKLLDIRGLSSGEFSEISGRYPAFADFLNSARTGLEGEAPVVNGEIPPDMADRVARRMDIGKAMGLAGTAWPAVIAAACDQPGDPETEAIAAGFAFNFQQAIVGEVMRLSFPAERPLDNGRDS
jgi:hypothetical protein